MNVLKEEYLVVFLDFQKLGNADFASEIIFCKAFVRYFFAENQKAMKISLSEKNILFESLMRQLYNSTELKRTVYAILFSGNKIVYNLDEHWMDAALMFGFVLDETTVLAYTEWDGEEIYPGDKVKVLTPAWCQNGQVLERGQCNLLHGE